MCRKIRCGIFFDLNKALLVDIRSTYMQSHERSFFAQHMPFIAGRDNLLDTNLRMNPVVYNPA